ncbi:MAG: hypothetical protein R2856_30675 [Caldilineaceae bacterium]
MNTSLIRNLSRQWGLVRSLIIYYAQPWRAVQARRFYTRYIRRGDLCFDVGARGQPTQPVGGDRHAWWRWSRCPTAWRCCGGCTAADPTWFSWKRQRGRSRAATIHLDPTNPTIATLS